MKIGFVRRGYSSTGGAEAYLQRLAHGVVAEGHVPLLLTSREWPQEAWPNEFLLRLDGRLPARFAEEVARASTGCDVVFSLERIISCDIYRAGDGVHCAWLQRRAEFEPFWRKYSRWISGKHRNLLRLEQCMFSPARTRCVIANSRMVRDEIVASYGYPADRIEIIPNGYDAPPPQEGLRERRRGELGIPPDSFVALFAGSGWERKGLRLAVRAVEEVPGVTLLVAGKGSSQPFRGASRTVFLGPLADLQPDFAAADVFVLPTIYDPFSNACLEAWAAGLPVITTTANGFSEVLTDGLDGTVIPAGDLGALAAALQSWKADGKAAGARADCRENASRYSMAENTRRTLQTITRVVPK